MLPEDIAVMMQGNDSSMTKKLNETVNTKEGFEGGTTPSPGCKSTGSIF